MTSLIKNGLTLGGLLLLAGLGYYMFVLQDDSNVELAGEADLNEARIASEQFLRELNAIQNFDLGDDLFTDPRFRSFVDFTTPVPEQPVGRENPFAPVE